MGKWAYAVGSAMCAVVFGLAARADSVDLAGKDMRVVSAADLAADGYVNSAEQTATLTLDFDDDVAALPSVAGAIRLVKLGAGTVAFATAQTYTGGTVVSNGLLSVGDQNWIGAPSAPITLAGGGLALLRAEKKGITLNRSVVVAPGATGTLAAQAEGGELSFANTSVVFKAATLRLAAYGTGTAWFNIARNANGSSYNSTGNGNGGAVVVEPNAWLNLYEGDAFGGANHQTDITLHIREGGVVSSGGNHSPLTRNVILEGGGRITATNLRLNGLADGRRVENMLDATTWQNLDLTRRLTVVPGSLTGAAEAVLDAPNVHLAPNDQDAVFDIQAGATLVVDSQLWPAHAQSNRSLRKTGTGTMELRRPLNIGGRFRVEEGTLRLADNTALGVIAGLDVSPNARIELGHGALVDTAPALTFPGSFLATADVWFDAAQLCGYADGDTVSTVTNRGTVGGLFGAFPFGNDFGRPTYAANALNGGPAIYCRGGGNGSGLYLDYTNKTDKLTVFFVMRWDGFENECAEGFAGNQGDNYWWHGPLAMGPATLEDKTASSEDYGIRNRFYFQWTGNLGTFGTYFVGQRSFDSTMDGTPTPDRPLVIGAVRDDTTIRSFSWWTDDSPAFKETSATAEATPWNIECIGLGTRLAYTNGKVKPNANRALKGWIGELIVFSRTLSDDETAFVQRYLQRKWGGSEQAAVAMPEVEGGDATVHVSVADGAEAVVNLILPSAEKRSEKVLSDQRIAKVGAGRLGVRAGVDAVDRIDVREGTALFNAEASAAAIWVDASDADTVTLADDHETVTAVRNKGHLGGVFKPNPYVVPGKSACPAPKYGALGERGALAFDGNSALALEASPTETTSREFFVCAALVRDSYVDEGGKGKWGGPIAFYSKSETGQDIEGTTGFHTEEVLENGLTKLSIGSRNGFNGNLKYDIADGTPFVFSCWETSMAKGTVAGKSAGVDVANETNDVDSVVALQGGTSAAMVYDIVQLGGRLQGGGAPQWRGFGDTANRMWNGRIGEMIVFDRHPARDQVAASIAYLRKKWLGAGDGSATPPAFLTGGAVADAAGKPAAWHVSADATLATAGKPAEIGPVALADGAALARENVVDAVDAFRLFDTPSLAFDGTVTVSAPAFPVGDVTLLTADAVTGTPVWQLVGEKSSGRKVSRRGSDYVITAPGLFIFVR